MKYAVWNPVERPAQVGDLVTMSIKEQVGEEVLNEDENFEYELTQNDEEDAGPDLVTPLIGLSVGEEKEFTVTYPETFGEARYAGQEVTVWAKLHTVKERELFPLDDDFAQTVGDFDSLEELKEKLGEDIYRQKQDQADADLGQEAMKQLVEGAERIEWPKVLEEEEIDEALDAQDQRLKETGLDLDTYLSVQKKTRQEVREEMRPAVQERLRRSLAVSKLVELEDLSIEGHEITDQVDRLSILAGERGAELREALAAPENVRAIASDLLSSKVVDRLVQIVKGEFEAEAEEIGEEFEADTQVVAQAKEEETEEEIEEAEEKETEIKKEVESDTEAAVSG
jgi:trigger factor